MYHKTACSLYQGGTRSGVPRGEGTQADTVLRHDQPKFRKETTMNDNDARLTRVYTAVTGGTVEEDIPDQPDAGEPADPDFDLFIEAAAGNNIGNSGTPYTLTITAVNAANGWASNGDDFVKTQGITLPTPAPAPSAPNDLYRFYVSLVTPSLQIASFAESNLF